jgi:hypothetical protein
MEHDQYIMLARRERELKERNKEIEKKRVELEQEYNRNKLEIEEIYVKRKKAEEEMSAWEGVTHGKN